MKPRTHRHQWFKPSVALWKNWSDGVLDSTADWDVLSDGC